MQEFSSITFLSEAEDASRQGLLVKTLLFPAELGGRDLPENTVYVPPHVLAIKNRSTGELLSAVRAGMNDVAITPEYRGTSFVPTKITITAASAGTAPGYRLEIGVW